MKNLLITSFLTMSSAAFAAPLSEADSALVFATLEKQAVEPLVAIEEVNAEGVLVLKTTLAVESVGISSDFFGRNLRIGSELVKGEFRAVANLAGSLNDLGIRDMSPPYIELLGKAKITCVKTEIAEKVVVNCDFVAI